MTIQRKLGEAIKFLRTLHGFNGKEFSKALQFSDSWLSSIEKGRQMVRGIDMERMEFFLALPLGTVRRMASNHSLFENFQEPENRISIRRKWIAAFMELTR